MDLLTRQQKIDAFYRRHLHPQASMPSFLCPPDGTLKRVCPPYEGDPRDAALTPLEHRHGYNCTCEACENCEPLELPPMRFPWPLLLCGLGCWVCIVASVIRWMR